MDRLGKVGDSTHRLSDFDQLGRAIALVMHGDEQVFVDAFESKTAIKSASALEGSVAGQAVLEYFRQRPYCNELRGSSGVVMNTVMPDSRHYNNPRFFKNDLIRVKNELADVGFEVTHEEKRAKVYDLVIKRAQTDDAVATISSQLKEALRAFANMSDTDRSTVIAALEHEQGLAEIQGLLDKELADSRLNDTRAKLDKAAAILGGIK